MSRERTPTEMAAIWTGKPVQQPLPWSPFQARLTNANGEHEEPLPTTDQPEEKE